MDSEQTVPEVQDPAPQSMFPEQVKLVLCTASICVNGHEWIPTVQLVKCGYGTPQGWNGCGAPILAIKQENCPVCNEPAARMRFRMDHTPPAPFPVPLCIPGSVSPAEVILINVERKAHTEAQTRWDKEHEKDKQ